MAEIDVKRSTGRQSAGETQRGQGQQRPGALSARRGYGGGGLAREGNWGWPVRPSLSPVDLWSAGPFELMRRMSEDMDRMFQGLGGVGAGAWIPPVEVAERQGKMVVSAELPGLGKDDVRVEATDEGLVISGERRQEHEEEEGGVYRSERSYGSFRRLIPLPDDAQLDRAEARFENGVLEVSVPVPESSARRRRIPIGTGETSSQQGTPEKRNQR